MRPQSSTDRHVSQGPEEEEFVDPVDLESPVSPKLPPFQVRLILNDEQAALKGERGSFSGELIYKLEPESDSLDSVAAGIVKDLPPLLEKAGIQCVLAKDGTAGKAVDLMMELTGYQLDAVLPNQTSKEFASALSALPPLVATLGAQKEYDEVLQRVKELLKIKWMQKIPAVINEKLLQMGIDAEVSVQPQPPPVPKPEQLPAPGAIMELYLRVEQTSRAALAQEVQPELTPERIKEMPQVDYLRLIRPKLEEHVAKAIREKLGDAFPFQGEPQSDADFGQHSKHSFWLPLTVHNVDIAKAVRRIKGEEFAGDFAKFMRSLTVLNAGGVSGLADVVTDLRGTVQNSTLKNLSSDLQRGIAELLGAEVQAVSGSTYTWLQKQAMGGVCCRSEKEDPTVQTGESKDEVFWVESAATAGADGPEGLCPVVSEEANPPCASTPKSREKVTLHHRPYTECFNLEELNNFDEVPLLTAPKVSSKCGPG